MNQLLQVLSAIFWGALVLNVLVFVHEGGHYLAARAFGMRVTEFFIGMPCRFKLSRASKKRGTEFGVTPVLIGGYTRICGMDGEPGPHAADVLGAVSERGHATLADIAAAAGCSEDEALAELALLVEWGSLEPRWPEGTRPSRKEWPDEFQTVDRDPDLLTRYDKGHDFAREGSTRAGEPHALPEGGAKALLAQERSRTYLGKGFLPRLVALVAGPAVNIVVGLALVAGTLSFGGVQTVRDVPVVGAVSEGSLAAACGVEAGDEIESVAGLDVSTWTDMGGALRGAIASGEPFQIRVSRAGEELTLAVDPASADASSGLFGISAVVETYHPGPVESVSLACRYVGMTANYVLQLLEPAHTQEIVSQSSSVVGISVAASEAAQRGPADLLFLMAAISLSLGFMNLLPIPPLDGGKIVIEVVQALMRRQVSVRAQNAVSYLGLALIMVLFFFVLQQDIVRIVQGG